ncbi:MAG: Kdo domain containing protein [Flavobacteriales bacterium]|jgi:hypothetical protein|uniref:lipopolysaccharide kinase InaA family protein n=1 Tax=Candidatus Ulvibacter alkanivorans TaxID=2267620 RepID=UPI000DF2BC9E|nr:lipopolysaccharide kinase InaA family protein [Candidatus Ulvibacter alkanivorans]MCH2490932.1 Kdo domain containing protein [Flavobacteriales bacterium]
MKERFKFSTKLEPTTAEKLYALLHKFDELPSGIGTRNVMKVTNLEGMPVNIKAFKIPNLVNKFAYAFFRASKAKRSYSYAKRLLAMEVKTPMPLAYLEQYRSGLFDKSFYVSKNLEHDLTIREIVDNDQYPNYETILRAFTRFTFSLHEKNINFLDHSPGNTLIVETAEGYDFYLVDLNRMKFETMDFQKRMKNFAKLSPKDRMLEIMCDEYAKLYPQRSKIEIKEVMYAYSYQFSTAYKKKEAFKKKYFFWRKR